MNSSKAISTMRARKPGLRHLAIWLIAAVTLLSQAPGAQAGRVDVVTWQGRQVLKIEGTISQGMAQEIATKLFAADVWPHGAKVLLLDSRGGSVAEALRISGLFDRQAVHAVVPNDARCASACASVVFVGATYRTVEHFGLLGQHSCAVNGRQDKACNEVLANHAVGHGVSHGAIGAFVTYSPPEQMVWFSRQDVDGWGLSRYPGEEASGFQKSEPRAIRIITGRMPAAQTAWRLDFQNDGYRAFVRPSSDFEREMQLNFYCYAHLPGRYFMSMEVHGPAEKILGAFTHVTVGTESVRWTSAQPWVIQLDEDASAIVTEVPGAQVNALLTASDRLVFEVGFRSPFVPMRAETRVGASRANLIFAANNCATADYGRTGQGGVATR